MSTAGVLKLIHLPFSTQFEYQSSELSRIGRNLLGSVAEFVDSTARKPNTTSFKYTTSVYSDLFGKFGPDHPFRTPWNFGFSLSEPQITKSLVAFCTSGAATMQIKRTRALLTALKIKDKFSDHEILSAQFRAEENRNGRRTDIEVFIQRTAGTSCLIVIEVKFDAHFQDKQLSSYRKSIRQDVSDRVMIVLAKSDRTFRALSKTERKDWNFVSWSSFWLRFQRLRPENDDVCISLLMNDVWHKIGKLKYA